MHDQCCVSPYLATAPYCSFYLIEVRHQRGLLTLTNLLQRNDGAVSTTAAKALRNLATEDTTRDLLGRHALPILVAGLSAHSSDSADSSSSPSPLPRTPLTRQSNRSHSHSSSDRAAVWVASSCRALTATISLCFLLVEDNPRFAR